MSAPASGAEHERAARSGLSTVPEFSELTLHLDAPIATITLNRPQAMNAITPTMLAELEEAFELAAAADDVPVIILTGAGRAFSAGVDLKSLRGAPLTGGAVGELLDGPARRVIHRIRHLDAVVIAKVNGYCFTGALEIALACDVIICADEAVFGDTHAKWGLRPSWGMSQRLPGAVGLARARLLSYTATTFSGVDAATWGLATLSCPRHDLDETVAGVARQIAANSAGALTAYKDLYRQADDARTTAGLEYEAAARYDISDTEQRVAGFR
ncbi:enoyl-CoA hydratase/isomerase family protein [Frankia sp. R43]|uniref:enoyl-CoA hydratase/isomerase family protein n=1 Tax=Frankia sp. R43 TaxID=269536 RepID=UPI0009F8D834|nr:enoyl-CoA hydratase/isomerase family protein [Frankia sp. R43]